jgi:hypothetical protein
MLTTGGAFSGCDPARDSDGKSKSGMSFGVLVAVRAFASLPVIRSFLA